MSKRKNRCRWRHNPRLHAQTTQQHRQNKKGLRINTYHSDHESSFESVNILFEEKRLRTSLNLRSEREVQRGVLGGWMRFLDGRLDCHMISELVDVNQGMCVL
jgi:hypothetical protein